MKLASLLVFLAASSLLLADKAHAYLDPGTGSVILQVVAAGVLGALFTIKSYWRAMLGFFTGRKKANDSETK